MIQNDKPTSRSRQARYVLGGYQPKAATDREGAGSRPALAISAAGYQPRAVTAREGREAEPGRAKPPPNPPNMGSARKK